MDQKTVLPIDKKIWHFFHRKEKRLKKKQCKEKGKSVGLAYENFRHEEILS